MMALRYGYIERVPDIVVWVKTEYEVQLVSWLRYWIRQKFFSRHDDVMTPRCRYDIATLITTVSRCHTTS